VTRVVLDLKTQQPFQVFTSGKTVIVKLSTDETPPLAVLNGPAMVSTFQPVPPQPAQPPKKLAVEFKNGKLSIWSDKATLAEVLNEVHRRTGADIPIPSGAQQEQVVANFGPGPAREVLASLLNGSRFNFIMVGSARNPADLRSVLLTPRGEGMPQVAIYSPPPTQTPTAQFVPEQPPVQAEQPMQMPPDQPEQPSPPPPVDQPEDGPPPQL
jgi:hypothetical protein